MTMKISYELVILGSASTAFAAALRTAELGKQALVTEARTLGAAGQASGAADQGSGSAGEATGGAVRGARSASLAGTTGAVMDRTTRGQLEAVGRIDLHQFWPLGESDADTTKLVVRLAPSASRFRPALGRAFHVTRAFDDAIVIGKIRRPAIDAKGRVVVRLQGVDAPELHYRPASAR